MLEISPMLIEVLDDHPLFRAKISLVASPDKGALSHELVVEDRSNPAQTVMYCGVLREYLSAINMAKHFFETLSTNGDNSSVPFV